MLIDRRVTPCLNGLGPYLDCRFPPLSDVKPPRWTICFHVISGSYVGQDERVNTPLAASIRHIPDRANLQATPGYGDEFKEIGSISLNSSPGGVLGGRVEFWQL